MARGTFPHRRRSPSHVRHITRGAVVKTIAGGDWRGDVARRRRSQESTRMRETSKPGLTKGEKRDGAAVAAADGGLCIRARTDAHSRKRTTVRARARVRRSARIGKAQLDARARECRITVRAHTIYFDQKSGKGFFFSLLRKESARLKRDRSTLSLEGPVWPFPQWTMSCCRDGDAQRGIRVSREILPRYACGATIRERARARKRDGAGAGRASGTGDSTARVPHSESVRTRFHISHNRLGPVARAVRRAPRSL